MAEAAITAVLSKLGELAAREERLKHQVGEDIILLRDKLEWLRVFVRDADRRRRRTGTDDFTRVWVRQTRVLVFEAEDALDDFFYEEKEDTPDEFFCGEVVGLKQCYVGVQKILHKFFTCFFTPIVARHVLADRIKSIKSRLENISVNQKEYNIEHAPTTVALSSSTTAISAWRDDMENAVGFDEDVEILKQMLHNDQMFIVSIVGESGSGKRTLAKIIRHEMATSPEIEVLVWYHMEPGCSMEDLLQRLTNRAGVYINFCRSGIRTRPWPNEEYKKLRQAETNITDPRLSRMAGNILHQTLVGKRYMLILGGIFSKSILNSVMACLPHQSQDSDNGSRVMLILDSANEEVAWHANTMNRDSVNGVHLLTRLDQARSAQLFIWKVSRKGESKGGSRTSNSKDSEYLRLVHHITGGYPMAIVLLAGLLRFKEKPVEWDAVLQELISGSETQGSGNGQQANILGTKRAMKMIFWASFEDLPNDLKSCFLYFASYAEKFSHPADQLVRMWIAEGFIRQPGDGKTMEELGHDYLKELVLRCLVELEETKTDGGIELVRVHKSLMGLLRSEVREAGFMEILNTDDSRIPPSVRRLSVQSGKAARRFENLPTLRSFICHIHEEDKEFYFGPDLKFLQWSNFICVISVQGLILGKLPDEIGDMMNLRYLRIACYYLISIPSSISRLLNLQTLDIRYTKIKEIDKDFWKIKTLRHVIAEDLLIEGGGGGSEIQTLHGVRTSRFIEWSEGNCPLDNMANLRSLQMTGFSYNKHGGTAFRSALKKMHLLSHFELEGDDIPSYVLTHPNLGSLRTMVLKGTVKWDDAMKELPVVDHPLRMVRPNLVRLEMNDISGMPQSIKDQLEGILL